MHRNKDVILGEDGYTNRCGNAPRNIFSLTGFVLKTEIRIVPPTRAIERFQDVQKPRDPAVLGLSLNRPDTKNDEVDGNTRESIETTCLIFRWDRQVVDWLVKFR